MEQNTRPASIFGQMMYGLKTVNDNIVTMSQNMQDLDARLSRIEQMLTADISEPTASGAEQSDMQ